jgi:hypothetical protein
MTQPKKTATEALSLQKKSEELDEQQLRDVQGGKLPVDSMGRRILDTPTHPHPMGSNPMPVHVPAPLPSAPVYTDATITSTTRPPAPQTQPHSR